MHWLGITCVLSMSRRFVALTLLRHGIASTPGYTKSTCQLSSSSGALEDKQSSHAQTPGSAAVFRENNGGRWGAHLVQEHYAVRFNGRQRLACAEVTALALLSVTLTVPRFHLLGSPAALQLLEEVQQLQLQPTLRPPIQ